MELFCSAPFEGLTPPGSQGYFEPSAKRVWCHALLIMWPEVLALPVALMTCKGHGCAGFVAFLFLASLFTLILMAASFGAFFIRRRRT